MNPRLLLMFAAILCTAAPACAHAFLEHATPGAGATLAAAPSRVVLKFSETLKPALSGVAVTDGGGREVESAPFVVSGKSMVALLRPLPPGSYRVAWHAVSPDAHRTQGAYSFTVRR